MKNKFLDPDIPRKSQILNRHLAYQYLGPDKETPPLFTILEFNLTGLCNRKCIFCPRRDPAVFPNIDKHISAALYEKSMADLGALNYDGAVIYSGFGEPLLHRDVENLIRLSKKYCPGCRIEIISNGDLATADKISGLFKAGLSLLCVSMYDGPHQIKYFNRLKNKIGLRDDQLVLRKRWLPPAEHFGIALSNRAGMLKMEEPRIGALTNPMPAACYYPFYQTLIDYDGSVLLCTHDWGRRLIAGNVSEQSILAIWNGELFRKIRLGLINENRNFSPCNLCDCEGVLMGKNHFNKWIEYYRQEQFV